MRRLILLSVLCSIYLIGCASRTRYQGLGDIYNSFSRYEGPRRNPVILINGIMGSRLVDNESHQLVWGAFYGNFANPKKPEGARLYALPMQKDIPLNQIKDSVVPDGVVDIFDVSLLGFRMGIIADFHYILHALDLGGYRIERTPPFPPGQEIIKDHFNCFQYDYDWRRDNVENAIRLHEFILEKRVYMQQEYEKLYGVKDYDVKFDIVAYSMGGLITRYYVKYGPHDLPADGSLPPISWEGNRYVNKVIICGSPSAGSSEALLQLVKGRNFGPFMPTYKAQLIGTFPSAYQLLPRGRHGALVYAQDTNHKIDNILDPKLWEEMGWGLASPDADPTLQWLLPDIKTPQERHQIALDHLRKCLERAKQFTAAIDEPSMPPPNVTFYVIAGDGLPTVAVVSLDTATGVIKTIRKDPGDSTVLRSSVLMDERLGDKWSPNLISPIHWTQATFIHTKAFTITNDPGFIDNLLYLLLEKPN